MGNRRLSILALAALAVLAVLGCSSAGPNAEPSAAPSAADAILAPYGLAGLDGVALVDRLDRLPVAQRPADLRVSVRPGQLLLSDQRTGAEATLALPADQFYLSVAPYLERTHECFFHSLTTCRGELGGRPVAVSITNRASGEVLVDTTVMTFDNGFAGFWLPAGVEADIRVAYEGRTVTAKIGTGSDDPTCLTSLRL